MLFESNEGKYYLLQSQHNSSLVGKDKVIFKNNIYYELPYKIIWTSCQTNKKFCLYTDLFIKICHALVLLLKYNNSIPIEPYNICIIKNENETCCLFENILKNSENTNMTPFFSWLLDYLIILPGKNKWFEHTPGLVNFVINEDDGQIVYYNSSKHNIKIDSALYKIDINSCDDLWLKRIEQINQF